MITIGNTRDDGATRRRVGKAIDNDTIQKRWRGMHVSDRCVGLVVRGASGE
jgi:hypothetical protein